jgi:putative transposase
MECPPKIGPKGMVGFPPPFKDQGITPSRMTPGKPWRNGSNERFNGTFRRECLDAERFSSLTEAQVVIEDWRRQYNQDRPHSTLDFHSQASAYGCPLSRGAEARGLSAPAGEKSTHTIGREAPIVTHPAPGVVAFETSTSVGRKS